VAYLGADFIGDFLESLPDSFNRTGGLKDESSLALLVVELGLGAPVDIANNLVDGLLQLTTGSDLVGSKRDAFSVLAGDVHGRVGADWAVALPLTPLEVTAAGFLPQVGATDA
jgi:hypothetical protein